MAEVTPATRTLALEIGPWPLQCSTTADGSGERKTIEVWGAGFNFMDTKLAALSVNQQVVIVFQETGIVLVPPMGTGQIIEGIMLFFDRVENDSESMAAVLEAIKESVSGAAATTFFPVQSKRRHEQN